MSFLSGIKAFGRGVEHVFGWMGSPTGQRDIALGEAAAEAFGAPPAAVNLANDWFKKIYTVESLAAVAANSAGTGADKATLAMQTMTPTILEYAKQEGVSTRTAAQIQTANDALVAFLRAMTDPTPTSSNPGIVPPAPVNTGVTP